MFERLALAALENGVAAVLGCIAVFGTVAWVTH